MTIKTVEFVTPAHPDKMCDQISDIILDECLKQDPDSRVAIETMIWHWEVKITGELTTNAEVDFVPLIEKVLEDNRYDPEDFKQIDINIVKQSNYIAQGVDTGWAGDQWIMVGYATIETANLMPLEYEIARDILYDMWHTFPQCRDAKSQVTTEDWNIKTIVVSAERMQTEVILNFLKEKFPEDLYWEIRFIVNPCWDRDWWPDADAGVTWRKLVVDNYWPQIEIGWWAFSGKDPSKVDRSGAYYARYLATKNLIEKWLRRCKVKIAYSIWIADPVMVSIESDQWEIEYDWPTITPKHIKEKLELTQPMYYRASKRWHFGREFNWDYSPAQFNS